MSFRENCLSRCSTYHVEIVGFGEPLFCCMDLQVINNLESFFIHDWGINSKDDCVDIIGHGQTDSLKDVRALSNLSMAQDLKQYFRNS